MEPSSSNSPSPNDWVKFEESEENFIAIKGVMNKNTNKSSPTSSSAVAADVWNELSKPVFQYHNPAPQQLYHHFDDAQILFPQSLGGGLHPQNNSGVQMVSAANKYSAFDSLRFGIGKDLGWSSYLLGSLD